MRSLRSENSLFAHGVVYFRSLLLAASKQPECLSLGCNLISPPAKIKDKERGKVNRAWKVAHR